MARSLDSAEEIDDVFDERVGQRCMMGETLHVAHSYPQSMVADQLLKRAAYPNATDEWLRELDLADFNDSEDTTHEMMLAAFDRAIETEKTRTA